MKCSEIQRVNDFMSQNDISVQDDPARAPPYVTKCPIEYRISIGTC